MAFLIQERTSRAQNTIQILLGLALPPPTVHPRPPAPLIIQLFPVSVYPQLYLHAPVPSKPSAPVRSTITRLQQATLYGCNPSCGPLHFVLLRYKASVHSCPVLVSFSCVSGGIPWWHPVGSSFAGFCLYSTLFWSSGPLFSCFPLSICPIIMSCIPLVLTPFWVHVLPSSFLPVLCHLSPLSLGPSPVC